MVGLSYTFLLRDSVLDALVVWQPCQRNAKWSVRVQPCVPIGVREGARSVGWWWREASFSFQ